MQSHPCSVKEIIGLGGQGFFLHARKQEAIRPKMMLEAGAKDHE
jgi:hypothetical protein